MQRMDTPGGIRYYRVPVLGPGGEETESLYPSVTTIISTVLNKPALVPWGVRECCAYLREQVPIGKPLAREELESLLAQGKRQHQLRLEEASAFGSEAHAHVETFLKEGRLPILGRLDPRMKKWIIRWHEWWTREAGLTCLQSEQIVLNHEYAYAGTMDAVAVGQDGRFYVVDFKSSGSWAGAVGYILQGVAYREALSTTWAARFPNVENGCAEADVVIVRISRRDATLDTLHIRSEQVPLLFEAFLSCRMLFDLLMDGGELVKQARCGGQAVQTRRASSRDGGDA